MASSTNQTQPSQLQPGILVPVSPGELIDKITILEIKNNRLRDPHKLDHVRQELALLTTARDQAIPPSLELTELTVRLRLVNQALWQIEEEVRVCEHMQDFGSRFIALARSVYQRNDERAALKQEINRLLHASFQEQKSYGGSG